MNIKTRVWKLKMDITQKECFWLDEDEVYKKGDIVFSYDGFTYGCVTDSGIPIRRDPTIECFCEIPKIALELIGWFND